jgi:hypothetical protein
MGNRGILHDESRRILRPWKGKAWVCCVTQFKGVGRKPLFQPRRYSELFFLDESTAFSAGHRPCAYCQRDRFDEFKTAWVRVHHPTSSLNDVLVRDIDALLHPSRAVRGGGKVTYAAIADDLPDGTFIDVDGVAHLKHNGGYRQWSFEGYGKTAALPGGLTVPVLTPKPFVQMFAAGFQPLVHWSADA